MRKTLRYSFSIIICLLLTLPISAQEGRVRGPRIGYNAGSLALLLIEPDRSIHTFSIDYEILQDFYPIIEFGWQNLDIKKDNYRYFSDGIFFRLGMDKNVFKYDNPVDYDMGFAGIRYGMSFFSHNADNIDIEEGYWGGLSGGEVSDTKIKAHWISIGGGLRAEVFKNIFMGWSAFANIKLGQTRDLNMDPFNIPGFGDSSRRLTLSINYSIYYRIAISKFE